MSKQSSDEPLRKRGGLAYIRDLNAMVASFISLRPLEAEERGDAQWERQHGFRDKTTGRRVKPNPHVLTSTQEAVYILEGGTPVSAVVDLYTGDIVRSVKQEMCPTCGWPMVEHTTTITCRRLRTRGRRS